MLARASAHHALPRTAAPGVCRKPGNSAAAQRRISNAEGSAHSAGSPTATSAARHANPEVRCESSRRRHTHASRCTAHECALADHAMRRERETSMRRARPMHVPMRTHTHHHRFVTDPVPTGDRASWITAHACATAHTYPATVSWVEKDLGS
jgi:hypothetical protein